MISNSSLMSFSLNFSFCAKNFTIDEPEPPKNDSFTSFITWPV